MIIRFKFCWYAWYIGAFYSVKWKTLYLNFIPMIGISISFPKKNYYVHFDCPLDNMEDFH